MIFKRWIVYVKALVLAVWIKLLAKSKDSITEDWVEPAYHDFSYPVINNKK